MKEVQGKMPTNVINALIKKSEDTGSSIQSCVDMLVVGTGELGREGAEFKEWLVQEAERVVASRQKVEVIHEGVKVDISQRTGKDESDSKEDEKGTVGIKNHDRPEEHNICPATNQIILMRDDICQEYNEIPQCALGVCPMYPVLDRQPTAPIEPRVEEKEDIGVKAKRNSSTASIGIEGEGVIINVDAGVIRVGTQEHKIEGTTFGEKLRSLRTKLSKTMGIDRVREILNSIANTKKKASIEEDEFKVGELIWLSASAYAEDNKRMMFGKIASVRKYEDGSLLIKIEENGRTGAVIDKGIIIRRAALCENYLEETGQCKSGCANEGVFPGNMCAFYEQEHVDCRCFPANVKKREKDIENTLKVKE